MRNIVNLVRKGRGIFQTFFPYVVVYVWTGIVFFITGIKMMVRLHESVKCLYFLLISFMISKDGFVNVRSALVTEAQGVFFRAH